MPALQCASDASRVSVRKVVRDDENTRVWLARLKEPQSQADEVVPIARDQDTLLRCCETQLGIIRKRFTAPADLVNADNVQIQRSRSLRHGGIDVFVQQVAQSEST